MKIKIKFQNCKYGFILLWFIAIYLITHFIGGYHFKAISITDVGWEYSVIIVFIISKVLSLEVVQEKFDNDLKYLVKTVIILLVLGSLIACGIEYIEDEVMGLSSLSKLLEILYFTNTSFFIVLLFRELKININEKDFLVISTGIGLIIILAINIGPIQKINNIISTQKKVYEIINANPPILTYENISTELGLYLPDVEISELEENQTWDYQFYEAANKSCLSVISSGMQYVNKSNFNEFLENLQSGGISYTLNTMKKWGRSFRNYRIASIIVCDILVIYMGAYLISKENKKYYV